MDTVAVAIVCKTPVAGQSKTRLSPPVRAEQCAALSACFIRDVSNTIQALSAGDVVIGYALYAPQGSQALLRPLLPPGFRLLAQGDGDLGARLTKGAADLFAAGHVGIVLVNSDAPTLPATILREAIDAVRRDSGVVLSPALDGGYTLIGLSRLHPGLFANIPWSTSDVYRATLDRARELRLAIANVPGWYDVDDVASLQVLADELSGRPPVCAGHDLIGADAPATRAFMRTWQTPSTTLD